MFRMGIDCLRHAVKINFIKFVVVAVGLGVIVEAVVAQAA